MENYKISFAVHDLPLNNQPLIRFDNISDARKEMLEDLSGRVLVCEVASHKKKKLVITSRRIISAPKIWIDANDFIPEYNHEYLCYVLRKESCGSFTKYQKVIEFKNNNWLKVPLEIITHFMIIMPPNSNLTQL